MPLLMPKPTMKSYPTLLSRPLAATLPVALLALLSACGGGGNELGGDETLTLSQSEVSVTAIGTCYAGNGPTVYVYGGRPPYTLYNSLPDGMALSSTQVSDSGGSFTIQFKGVCMASMPITVSDDMGRITSVLVSSIMEEDTSTTPDPTTPDPTTPVPTTASRTAGH